ncbi:MAG: alpha/beta fold hydrolase [Deltaproteobacteria bacterium]|nr:alpha/beta fold hydrolase [Deltaproteobacteria bacterium]
MEARKINGIGYTVAKWPLDAAKATIVFIHGAGGTRNFWQAQVEGLAGRANTVAIDLPGHGTSDGDGHDKVEDYARAVVDFMNAIEAPNPITCGFSLGGAITQQILLEYPDLARAGILICSGATMKVGPALFESIEKDYNGFVDFICKLASSKKTDPELVRPFREDFLSLKADTTHGDFRACNRFDVTDRLSSVAVPVLVVTAEEDKLTPPKFGDALEKGIKNATRAHIIGAGHIVPMEKSGEVNKSILKFIDQTGLYLGVTL